MAFEPLVVLFLGPPGAGKGTHAFPLSRQLEIPHISTGELFREHIRNKTPFGIEAKEYILRGNLVPDELVLQMFFERTSRPDCSRGYLLDGFPRTIAQAEKLQSLLPPCRLIALYFDVPDAVLIERITGRLACSNCARSYHKIYDPPKQPNRCDACKGILYTREDDREEVLRKRLEVYRAETAPLIHLYEGTLLRIDGRGTKEQVFQEVVSLLRSATAPASAASI